MLFAVGFFLQTFLGTKSQHWMREGGRVGSASAWFSRGQLIELKRVKSMTKKQLVSTSFGRDGRCYGPVKVLWLYPSTNWLFFRSFPEEIQTQFTNLSWKLLKESQLSVKKLFVSQLTFNILANSQLLVDPIHTLRFSCSDFWFSDPLRLEHRVPTKGDLYSCKLKNWLKNLNKEMSPVSGR